MYFKITNEKENHYSLQYQDGLVEDFLKFNDNKYVTCCSGGIYFSDEMNILEFCSYGPWIRQVEIPEDAQWLQDIKGNKYRASKLFFHPRRELWTVETFKWLIEQEVNIHADEEAALIWAAKNNNLDLVKFLLEQNPNITQCNRALFFAVSNKNFEMLMCLADKGADIYFDNNSLLRHTAQYNNLEIAKFLIEKGANVQSLSNDTVAVFASKGNLEAVNYLIEKGANINDDDERPFRLCVAHGHREMFNFLLEKVVNINAGNYSAVELAIRFSHLDILKVLIEKGAEFNKYKERAIKIMASDSLKIDMLKFLVEQGCDIHSDHDYAYRMAKQISNEEIIEYIESLK